MSQVTLTKESNWADVEVQSSIPRTDVTRMTVNADGAAHIMSLLTDLYSDAELAVLREYTSNAVDSHRAAGTTDPILVHLPVPLSPNFVVEDFGTGMSADEIRTIYSSYGASTKRNDLDQIGAFGLGCKSALTLTQQFTLESVKDGKRTVAHILRGADGVGEVSIISKSETKARNGVKITIPVPDVNSFTSKAADFFYTWNSDDVLVDGKKPDSIFDLDHIAITPSNGVLPAAYVMRPIKRADRTFKWESGLYVMVGGIRYEVEYYNANLDNAPLRSIINETMVILNTPIGAVDLTPSREALRYSARTKANLKTYIDGLVDDIRTAAIDDVSLAPTRKDAVYRRHLWSQIGTIGASSKDFVWNNEVMPKSVITSDLYMHYFTYSARSSMRYLSRTTAYTGTSERTIVPTTLVSRPSYYVVDSRTPDQIRAYGSMFRDYLLKNSKPLPDAELYHFTSAFDNRWVTDMMTPVTIDQMQADAKAYRAQIRASKPASTSAGSTLTYDVMTVDATGVSFSDMPASDFKSGWYYIDISSSGGGVDRILESFIKDHGYKHVYGSRYFPALIDLFKEAFPNGGNIVVVAGTRTVEALHKRVTFTMENALVPLRTTAVAALEKVGHEKAAIQSLRYNHWSVGFDLKNLDAYTDRFDEISVSDVSDLFKTLTTTDLPNEDHMTLQRIIAGYSAADFTKKIETADKALRVRVSETLDKYPLLAVLSDSSAFRRKTTTFDHVVSYLNSLTVKENN